MSVVILVPGKFDSIATALRHYQAQDLRAQIEMVIVTPSAEVCQPDAEALSVFHSWQLVEIGSMDFTSAARAAGIHASKAPIVVLGEDHAFPQAGWAAALLEAHRGPWAVVGPAVCNANPDSATSWANFLPEYGEWMCPAESGERGVLPGHNSAYKREVLLECGPDLPRFLDAECVLHWDLVARGQKLYLEGRAMVQHLNPSRFVPWLPNRYQAGRSFAGPRSRGWSWPRRLFYAAATLTLPVRDGLRLMLLARRARLRPALLAALAPLLFVNLCVNCLGRTVGYLFGFYGRTADVLELEFGRLDYLNSRDWQAEAQRRPASMAQGDTP